MFNVPPLKSGMITASWLEWFARANCYDSFASFRKELFTYMNKRGFVFSAGKSSLCPYLYGYDPAIDFVLDLLCSSQNGIDIRKIIHNNTIFPVLTSLYSSPQQQHFSSIIDCKQPLDKDAIVNEYDLFSKFQGLDNILSTKSDFLYRMIVKDGPATRYCPDCVKADIEAGILPYARTWHNFPYVCTCALHKKTLVFYPEGTPGINNEYMAANPCVAPENLQYSAFVYDFFQFVYNNNLHVDLTSFTYAIYRFQKSIGVSSWRLLSSILNEGYIDSAFHGLDVRSSSDRYTDQFYEDESLNYFMYEPQNMFCVLIHLFGTFEHLVPFLKDKNYEPSEDLKKDYWERHRSGLVSVELMKMSKEELSMVISDKTDGNCTLSHINQGTCYVCCKEIPDTAPFSKLSKVPTRVIRIKIEDVVTDLCQKHNFMFIPEKQSSIKYCPSIEREHQIKAFKQLCDFVLQKFIAGKRNSADSRRLLSSLPRNSYGLLSKKDSSDIFMETAFIYPEIEPEDNINHVVYKKTGKEALSA